MHGNGNVSSMLNNAKAIAAVSLGNMNRAFLSALRSRDASRACELCQISKNWPALVMDVIAQLDEAWNKDILSIGEIAETYWTLRRTLDELTSIPAEIVGTSFSIGEAVIWIPKKEQHTFGPQMLVDRIGHIGWNVQLWFDLNSEDALDQLASDHTDVLGVSVGTDYGLDGLADLFTQVRRCAMNPDIKIMVGGSAVRGVTSQYDFLGADCVATSAKDALHFFERGWNELERREGSIDG